MKFILFAAIHLSFVSISFAQLNAPIFRATEKASPENKKELINYLSFILRQPKDSILNLDTTKTYKIKFISSHAFEMQFQIFDSCYMDTKKLICIENVSKSKDSIQLNFIDPNVSYLGRTKIDNTLNLTFTNYKKLNQGGVFTSEHLSVISFYKGRYLILRERVMGPDIRSSMPPGIDRSYFIELIY